MSFMMRSGNELARTSSTIQGFAACGQTVQVTPMVWPPASRGGLHQARVAAVGNGEAALGEQPPEPPGVRVSRALGAGKRAAEDGHDPSHQLQLSVSVLSSQPR